MPSQISKIEILTPVLPGQEKLVEGKKCVPISSGLYARINVGFLERDCLCFWKTPNEKSSLSSFPIQAHVSIARTAECLYCLLESGLDM